MSVRNNNINLAWDPLHKGFFQDENPLGPNFTEDEICALVKEIGGYHHCPPHRFIPLILGKGQLIDCIRTEWYSVLGNNEPWAPSIGDEKPVLRSEIIKQIKSTIEVAGRKGIPKVLVYLGETSGTDRTSQWVKIKSSLEILIAHAKKFNVQLCIEVLNNHSFGKMYGAKHKGFPGQFTDQILDLHCLTDLFMESDGHLGIILDVYHAAIQLFDAEKWDSAMCNMTKNLCEIYNSLSQYIVQIHISGYNPSLSADYTRCAPSHIGQVIDFSSVIEYIMQSGYTGQWTIEHYLESPLCNDDMCEMFGKKSQACHDIYKTIKLCTIEKSTV